MNQDNTIRLNVPVESARERLQNLIDQALEFELEFKRNYGSSAERKLFSKSIENWLTRANRVLTQIFSTDLYSDQFNNTVSFKVITLRTLPIKVSSPADIRPALIEIISAIDFLRGVLTDIPHLTPADMAKSPPSLTESPIETEIKSVFIVHGHDNGMKQEVARFVERLDLDTVILHEKPNMGRHILTKLIEESSGCRYAIVLCSPDDHGCARGNDEHGKPYPLKPRARQNVVLELGLFIGHFGPNGVCALIKGDVEMPGDYDGVVYVPMDNHEGWKLKIINELIARGYEVDKNKM